MKLFWKSYAILFIFICVGNAVYFIAPQSPAYLYYGMMITFQPYYILPLAINLVNLLLAIISSVIVACYAFGAYGNHSIWRTLFYIRILSELFGHHYDFKFIQSSFAQSITMGFASTAILFLPLIPSYVGHYRFSSNLISKK